MGCAASAQTADSGQPNSSSSRPRSSRPIRREPRPLNSRHASPNASQRWHPSQQSNRSVRRGSGNYLQVYDNQNEQQLHELRQQQSPTATNPNSPTASPEEQLLEELNRQRKDVFSTTNTTSSALTMHEEACRVAKDAAVALTASADPDAVNKNSTANHGGGVFRLLTRILGAQEGQNIPLYLTNLMTSIKSKTEEADVQDDQADAAKADLCFWTSDGDFGCAVVKFIRTADQLNQKVEGDDNKDATSTADGTEKVALAMAFRSKA